MRRFSVLWSALVTLVAALDIGTTKHCWDLPYSVFDLIAGHCLHSKHFRPMLTPDDIHLGLRHETSIFLGVSDRHCYSMWWISQKASWVLCLKTYIVLGTNHFRYDDGFKVAWLELCFAPATLNYYHQLLMIQILFGCTDAIIINQWDLLGFYWVSKCSGLSLRNYVPKWSSLSKRKFLEIGLLQHCLVNPTLPIHWMYLNGNSNQYVYIYVIYTHYILYIWCMSFLVKFLAVF